MPVELGRARIATAVDIFVHSLAAAIVLVPPALIAQSPVDGAIAGRVVSAEGEPIAGAELALLGEEGDRRFAVSGRKGEFLIIRLTPGAYRLMARASGYRGQVEIDTTVQLGRTTELEVGHAVVPRSSVGKDRRQGIRLAPLWAGRNAPLARGRRLAVVDAKASLLTRDPDAMVVVPSELDALPITGGDWASLGAELPGVQADPDADGAALLTVRGLPPTENSSQIDGIAHDQSFGAVPVGAGADPGRDAEDDAEEGTASGRTSGGGSGGGIGEGRHAGAAYGFSQAAVREFRLSDQGYTALYGHAAGGVATAVTRSGTQKLHGSGFFTLRESGWAAANAFSVQTTYTRGIVASNIIKPQDTREQMGGTLGGPLWKDHLFAFAAFDRQTRDFPAISSPDDVHFYSLTATQLALLGTRGVTRSRIDAALSYLSSLTGSVPRSHNQTIAFARLDGRIHGATHLSVEGNRAVWNSPAGGTTAAVVGRGMASLGNNQGSIDEGVARLTTFFGARLSNEVRAGFGRDFQYETAQAPLPQEPAVGPGGFAPEVSIGPQGLLFGTPASLGRRAYPDERRLQVADTLAWIKGRHLLRAGGEMSRVHDRIDALDNQEGTYHYDSGSTGGHAGGLVDWITDYTFNVHAYPNGGCASINAKVHDFCFRTFSQSFGEQTANFDTVESALFVQDDWRMRTGLTVNLGVRYEYELLPFPQQPNAILDALFGKKAATSVFPEDRGQFGPRMGLSWQPFGRRSWVLHAGFGLYFGRLPGTTIRSALADTALPASTTHIRVAPGTETLCPGVPNQGFGYPCAYLTTPAAALATTTSATVFDRKYRLPVVQQGSATLEHELGAGMVASLSYRMNSDRHLPGSVDLNIAPSTATQTFILSGGNGAIGVKDGETFVVPIYTARVTTSFGPVTEITSRSNATYNALVAELRHRSRALDLRFDWTWSKALDYGQTGGGTPRTNGQFDPFVLGYDKGLSSLNYPHHVVAGMVWSPALHFERRWARAAANGWSLAPIFSESSGRPYSYNIFGGTVLKGGRYSINGSGGSTYLPTVGRNTLRLPDTMTVNVRFARALRLSERVRLLTAAEAFNAMNHLNYSGVATRAFLVGTPVAGKTPLLFQDAATVAAEGLNVRPFGTFTAAGTSQARERQVQLSIKLEF